MELMHFLLYLLGLYDYTRFFFFPQKKNIPTILKHTEIKTITKKDLKAGHLHSTVVNSLPFMQI